MINHHYQSLYAVYLNLLIVKFVVIRIVVHDRPIEKRETTGNCKDHWRLKIQWRRLQEICRDKGYYRRLYGQLVT